MIQAALVVKTQKCYFLLKIAQFMVLNVNSSEHKNTLRHRRDILGPVLESLGCILCISEIFENFHAFLQPERYSLILEEMENLILLVRLKHTVQVAKMHKNFQKFPKCKVCILSFPKPIPECLYDVSMYFYAHLSLPSKP